MADEAKRLGDEAFKAKDFAQAVEQYTEAIKQNPVNGTQAKHVLLSNRSGAHAALKNWDDALKDALSCIQAQSDFPKAWSRKGAALVGKGDTEGALRAYKRCLELDAANVAAKQEIARLEWEISHRSAAFSSAGAQATAQATAAGNKAPKALQALLLLLQLGAMVSAVQFLASTDPAQGRHAFGRVAMATMCSFIIEALVRHGLPGVGTVRNIYKAVRGQATQQDVQGIFNFAMDGNTHMVFYCSLLFSSMPALILLFPVLPIVLVSLARRVKLLLSSLPALFGPLGAQCDRIISTEPTLQRTSANSEVVILIILIFELFTPRRNLMLLILFSQMMRVRFLVNANSRAAWKTLEGYMDAVLLHTRSPSVVKAAYDKTKALFQSYAIPKK